MYRKLYLQLRHLDHCFYFDKLRMEGTNTDFGLFNYVEPVDAPKQANGFDCGVYIILNMMHYRTNWLKGVRLC